MSVQISLKEANKLLQMNESLVLINQEIDKFKANPSDSTVICNNFFNVQNEWAHCKSQGTLEQASHYQIVDIAMERTQKRVEKLLKKYQPVVLSNAQQIAQRANAIGYIGFYDDKSDILTACFGNFFSCQIEFGGKHFQNSESVFQSEKFTDQPALMAQFCQTDGDSAVKLARQNKMTITRLSQWDDLQKPHLNKVDVMMNALRAKFGQNPQLKDCLMATGKAYLVEMLPDPFRKDRFWSNGYDGTGENQLGICLMKLRGEYGGTGIVSKPQQYLNWLTHQNTQGVSAQNSLQNRCNQCHTYPKYTDALTGQIHNFCSKTCAKLAQNQSGLSGRCIQCHSRPKYLDTATGRVHDYCGQHCAGQAGVYS